MAAGTFFQKRIDTLERRVLRIILRKTGGNIRQAAKMIDERRSRLYRMMRRHGLNPDDFRHADPR